MGLLDQTSYSFSDPDGRDLFDMLVGLYRADRARSLALRAGVPVTTISFRTDVDAWQDLLPVAARSGRLRALAVVIMADDESVAVRDLLRRLIDDVPRPLPAGFDQYSLGLLPPRRAFINRLPLRDHLRELSDPDGARVLLVKGAPGLGKSHSWYLISYVGDRVGAYEPHRFDVADWTGPKMDARQLMAEMFIELGWPLAEVDLAAQPDTAVRLLVSAFKNRARNLPKPVCLVFDGFTSGTADEFARRFVVGMANAANEDLDLDVRVVLLEVEAQLPAILELEALSENLGNGRREDLPDFFKAAAKVVGERPDADAMKILVDTVLGPPPHPAEFPLSVVGPKAARVAGAAFRAAAGPPGQPAPRTVGASEIERRLAGIGDSWAPSPPDPVGEPRWRLRTAAVLRGFFNAGELADQARAAGGEITGDDLKLFIQHDCEALSSARGRGWQLSAAARAGTVRHLGADPRRLLQTTRGVPADQADLGRTMAELYLRREAPAVPAQSPDQLAGSLLAVDWLSGIDLGLPAAGQLRLQLQLSTLLEPLRSLLDKLFVGRSDPLRRLTGYPSRPTVPWSSTGPGGWVSRR